MEHVICVILNIQIVNFVIILLAHNVQVLCIILKTIHAISVQPNLIIAFIVQLQLALNV